MGTSTSSRSSTASSTLSISTLFQYSVFGIVLYLLAGAPLNSVLGFGTSPSDASYSSSNYGSAKTGDAQVIGQEKINSLVVPEKNLQCGGEKGFKGVHVLSREPLVVYIEGFLSEEESEHLVKLRSVSFFFSYVLSEVILR